MTNTAKNRPTSGRRRRGPRPGALLAALLLAGAGGCEESVEVTKPPPANVAVEVIRAEKDLPDAFTLPGVIEANRVVKVSAEIAGRVERVLRREGRPCRAGDRLVLLNTDILTPAHDQAKAQGEFNEREVKRVAEARRHGVATEMELDQARTRAVASRAAFDLAAANLARATIAAPIGGILNDLAVELGEYVSPGSPVAEIVDIDVAKVVVDVPERDVHFLRLEDAAEISVDSLAGRKVSGKITYISELADERARTTRAEISVPNAPGADGRRVLRSGQIVQVRLVRRVLPRAILIPLEAVIPLASGYVVYVVEDGKARRRKVTLGFFRGEKVRVLDGLADGDRLIVSGQRYVGPDQAVRVAADK